MSFNLRKKLNTVTKIIRCLQFLALMVASEAVEANTFICADLYKSSGSSLVLNSNYRNSSKFTTQKYIKFILDFFRKYPEQKKFYSSLVSEKLQERILYAYDHTSDLSLLHVLSRVQDLPINERNSFIEKVSKEDFNYFLKIISISTYYTNDLSRAGFFELIPYSSYQKSSWYDNFNTNSHLKLGELNQVVYDTLIEIGNLAIESNKKRIIYNTPLLRKLMVDHKDLVLEIIDKSEVIELFQKLSSYLNIPNEYWLILIKDLRDRDWKLSPAQDQLVQFISVGLSLEGPSWALRISYFENLAQIEYFRWKKNLKPHLNPLIDFYISKIEFDIKNDKQKASSLYWPQSSRPFYFQYQVQPNLYLDATDFRFGIQPLKYTSYLDPVKIEFSDKSGQPIIFSLESEEELPKLFPLMQMASFYDVWHDQLLESSQDLHVEIRSKGISTVVSVIPPALTNTQKIIHDKFWEYHLAFLKKKYQERLQGFLSSSELEKIQRTGRDLSYRSTLFTVFSSHKKISELLNSSEGLPIRGGIALTYSQSLADPLPLELEVAEFYDKELVQQVQQIIGDRSEYNKVVEIGKYAFEDDVDIQEYLFFSIANVLKSDPAVKSIFIFAPLSNSKLYKRKYGFEKVLDLPNRDLVIMKIDKEIFYYNIQQRVLNYLPNYIRGSE